MLLVFTLQVPLLSLIVAVGEAIVTGFVVQYLGRVRQDLLILGGVVGESEVAMPHIGSALHCRGGALPLDSHASTCETSSEA